ncbi:uncharacterized protein BDZ99DRAFT_468405 [Mytilinidion resinicola]|uniref:Uncharacterized protein n=1 Tax=Mytilinidion resinicola TaxID=574789 RepID=A0A6A6Y2M5_9PEZI|nr:uncharacterized protein BDZ99DRAFT_468405 [Mytilinidion resinicola]KAF2803061.1 hypothetical protein BDZ99DRAFT_468405 [Mytilinidion resinicola]
MPPPQPSQPTILHSLTTPALLTRILAAQSPAPATLVICSTRPAFLAHLVHATNTPSSSRSDALTPTLHTLATSSQIKLVFCPSVASLLGWLGVYKGTKDVAGAGAGNGDEETKIISGAGAGGGRILYLVDPLALHSHTPSFSAQGLGRCFAAAVEAAARAGEELVVVECGGKKGMSLGVEEGGSEGDDADMGGGDDGGVGGREDNAEEAGRGERDEDPWEQEVPILNTTMRRLGAGSGERGWAGRTVKVRTVAERWFRFDVDGEIEVPEEERERMDEM